MSNNIEIFWEVSGGEIHTIFGKTLLSKALLYFVNIGYATPLVLLAWIAELSGPPARPRHRRREKMDIVAPRIYNVKCISYFTPKPQQ